MDYAEAVVEFQSALDGVCINGETNGLSTAEMVTELRRYADSMESD